MESIRTGRKYFLKFNKLTEARAFHFSSTNQGWGGNGKSRFTGEQPETYGPFRKELANALKLKSGQLVFPRQIHGDRIGIIDQASTSLEFPDTDALVTNQPGVCICVQTADCVPILMFDPVQNVVAAVHAGWRGTVSKIVSKTIHKMQIHFDSEPEDLVVGIGPSISPHVYEVGDEVIDQVRENFDDHRKLLIPSLNYNKAFFDLWGANKSLLLTAGVPEEQIEIMGFCSFSHPSLFYSARRDGANTGRMVSGLLLEK
jgi:hypothetical protein